MYSTTSNNARLFVSSLGFVNSWAVQRSHLERHCFNRLIDGQGGCLSEGARVGFDLIQRKGNIIRLVVSFLIHKSQQLKHDKSSTARVERCSHVPECG